MKIHFLRACLVIFLCVPITSCESGSDDDIDQMDNDDDGMDGNDDAGGDGNQGNTTSLEQKIEGLYFLGGAVIFATDLFNVIRTDNPFNTSFPRSGKLFYKDLGIDIDSIPFIAIATQTINSDKDVFNVPNVTDFSYNILVIVRAIDAPDLEPNIRIEGLEDITFSPNGTQGQDARGQAIVDLDTGAFEITSLDDSFLFNSDDGELGNSFTARVSPEDFPRNADGAITVHSPQGTFNVPNLLDEIFNDDNTTSYDAVMLELIRGTVGMDGNGDDTGEITFIRPYNN